MKVGQVEAPIDAIAAFCQRWNVAELSLFGSALRDDFGPDSDVDVLIHFGPGGTMTLESMMGMRDELSAIFGGREVDLVERRLVTNPFRRFEILTHREILYAA
jgi:predicted nucleotidyltransferase